MSRQDQSVEEGAEAYQAGRDVVVHKTMSPAQMAEIMVALAGQLKSYLDEAETKAEARYRALQESILAEFAKEGTKAKAEAFSEPDYQRVVQDAQEAFSRGGTDDLKKELVRLLAERSAQPTGSRLAMVLNEAIRTAGNLTSEEYAALAAIFMFKYAKINGSVLEIEARLNVDISSFIDDLPDSDGSYDYLQAMRCVSINPLSTDFWSIIHQTYSSDFSLGFSADQLKQDAGNDDVVQTIAKLIVPATNHFGGNVRFNAKDADELRSELAISGIGTEEQERLVALFERTRPTQEALRADLSSRVPLLARLAEIWSNTALAQATLTALGKALAHSALVNRSGLSTPVEIWVK